MGALKCKQVGPIYVFVRKGLLDNIPTIEQLAKTRSKRDAYPLKR